jgi:hypothetical protein
MLGTSASITGGGISCARASCKYSHVNGQSIVFSLSAPQHCAQIPPFTPGQSRRARRFSHNLQGTFTGGGRLQSPPCFYRSIAFVVLFWKRRDAVSYDRIMVRTDIHLKVELDLDDDEKPERLAAEICRMIKKVYGVRTVEVSSIMEKDH